MEVMQDTCAKVPEFIWGGWDQWGAQEVTQYAKNDTRWKITSQGSASLKAHAQHRGTEHTTSMDTAC